LLPGILGFAVDNAAHLGGIAGGFAVAYVAGTPRLQGATEQLWKFAAIACVILTALAFGLMVRDFMTVGVQ
jgi:rhomboid protease GluP